LGKGGVKIGWAALLRSTDGKGTVAYDVALLLRDFFAQRRRQVRKGQAGAGARLRKTQL
jgi:hypothetical protein